MDAACPRLCCCLIRIPTSLKLTTYPKVKGHLSSVTPGRSNPQSDLMPEFTCTTLTHKSYKGHGGQEGADTTGLVYPSGETSGSTLASSHTHTKMLT